MANKAFETKENILSDMMVQLNTQNAKRAKLEEELQYIRFQLEQASKTLAQKDQIIGSLEQDLEHMIDQLDKIKRTRTRPVSNCINMHMV